jgi:hypothetical protein
MKDWVQTQTRRELQATGHLINDFNDLIGTKIPWLEFPALRTSDSSCRTMVQAQPNPITNCIEELPVASIIITFSHSLSLFETAPDVTDELSALLQSLGYNRHSNISDII